MPIAIGCVDVFETLRRFLAEPDPYYGAIVIASLVGIVAMAIVRRFVTGHARRVERGALSGGLSRRYWRRIAWALLELAALALATTAYLGIVWDGRLHAWLLLGHVTCGGMLVAGLFASTIEVATRRFATGAERWAPLDLGSLILGVATAASMMLSMLPWLATSDLRAAIGMHRYLGLAFIVVVAVRRLARISADYS